METTPERPSGRAPEAMRPIHFERSYTCHAEGSVLVSFGQTKVICTASINAGVPGFLRGKGEGWLTAEYGMLPRSTGSRMDREAARGKQSGRTVEIQRLIGRSLRAVTDLQALGERQIKIDCDVIQADGGTRTAAITGAWVALRIACEKLLLAGAITKSPLTRQVAAISCGVFQGGAILDLEYDEDGAAEIDANFVMTADDQLVEVQATGEAHPFSRSTLNQMLDLASAGCGEIFQLQQQAVRDAQ